MGELAGLIKAFATVACVTMLIALFVWLISHQPAVLFSRKKPATSQHYFSLVTNQHQSSERAQCCPESWRWFLCGHCRSMGLVLKFGAHGTKGILLFDKKKLSSPGHLRDRVSCKWRCPNLRLSVSLAVSFLSSSGSLYVPT
jgi:hypothetical protein